MTREYPSDWNSRRRKVYKRDNYTCQNCGAQGRNKGNAELHAHHIVPKSKGGTHQLSNLKTICSQCHDAVHGSAMAPSAENSTEKSDQGFFEEIQETDSEHIFQKCPFCGSSQIGAGDYDKKRIICQDCEVKFRRETQGLEIINMGPKNYSSEFIGPQLSAPFWKKLGKINDPSNIDFSILEQQSRKLKRKVGILRLVGLGSYMIIFIWMILDSWALYSRAIVGICFVFTVLFIVKYPKQLEKKVVDIQAARE